MTAHNPQPGEVFHKGNKSREVVRVERNDVYYKNQYGKEMACWITTWQQWCKDAVMYAPTTATKPALRLSEVAELKGDDYHVRFKVDDGDDIVVLIPSGVYLRGLCGGEYGLNLVTQGHYT